MIILKRKIIEKNMMSRFGDDLRSGKLNRSYKSYPLYIKVLQSGKKDKKTLQSN